MDRMMIEDLRREAGEAGDVAQVEICEMALGTREPAGRWTRESAEVECLRVIDERNAMHERGGWASYAAIGSDGMRYVVWGLGDTVSEAARDARDWYGDGWSEAQVVVVPCTDEAARLVRAGHIECECGALVLEGHEPRSGGYAARLLRAASEVTP